MDKVVIESLIEQLEPEDRATYESMTNQAKSLSNDDRLMILKATDMMSDLDNPEIIRNSGAHTIFTYMLARIVQNEKDIQKLITLLADS